MGKVKKFQKQQINKAAANFLCDQPEGDLYEVYLELKKLQKIGQGNVPAMNFVEVPQAFEHLNVGQIVDLIECAAMAESEILGYGLNSGGLIMCEKKTVCVCDFCGSDRVEVKAWIRPNKNNKVVDWVNEGDNHPDDNWCDDCQLHYTTSTVQVDKKAKVIGFQVEDQFGKHEMHPDMDASFCVYNLHQADEMVRQDKNKWQIKAIWTGDIEKPTLMFKGKNPYNF